MLIDAGLSGREIERRLNAIGVEPGDVGAICLSHEHQDHVQGAMIFGRRYGIPLYANAGTIEAIERKSKKGAVQWHIFTTHAPFGIGPIRITPFAVPHDAYEPVGFRIEYRDCRIGIVTDVGRMTDRIKDYLRGCHALVLESNHDEALLQQSRRPRSLIQRIMSRQGHLSNRLAAEALLEIVTPDLRHVYLAHLSSECNRDELAHGTVSEALLKAGHGHVRVELSYSHKVSSVWEWPGLPSPDAKAL